MLAPSSCDYVIPRILECGTKTLCIPEQPTPTKDLRKDCPGQRKRLRPDHAHRHVPHHRLHRWARPFAARTAVVLGTSELRAERPFRAGRRAATRTPAFTRVVRARLASAVGPSHGVAAVEHAQAARRLGRAVSPPAHARRARGDLEVLCEQLHLDRGQARLVLVVPLRHLEARGQRGRAGAEIEARPAGLALWVEVAVVPHPRPVERAGQQHAACRHPQPPRPLEAVLAIRTWLGLGLGLELGLGLGLGLGSATPNPNPNPNPDPDPDPNPTPNLYAQGWAISPLGAE